MGNQDGGVVLCSTNPPMEPQESSSKCCDECNTNEFKYKCPGCSLRSCSLPCVKAHKQRTGCTGKRRQQTEFVPLSKFDDNLLLSDYSMLEDVKRIADSAKRMRVQICGNYYNALPHHLKNLLNAARYRKIRLFFLPTGMSKRETNKTYCRKKTIFWTIEWRFHSTNVKLIDHGVHENSNIQSVIEKHIKSGPINHPLKLFSLEPMESLRFFISKHPKQARSPFRELDINAPIHEQLTNLVIVEYPIIHVFLPSHKINFEVIKDIVPFVPRPIQPKFDLVNESQPCLKGVVFKEEEIKDEDDKDPHVLDLMKQSNKKEIKDEGCIQKDVDLTNDDKGVDLMSFDFDPELIDVYSNLISETNPDDFLDLDGLLCDNIKEGKFGGVEEELEEGEIADSD